MEKINIAELLKDCPRGMELDCTICNGVKFIELSRNPNFAIVVRANNGYEFSLTKYGQVHNIDDAKCVIFPKGKTTWAKFQRPFKDGDIVATLPGNQIFIFKEDGVNEDNLINGVCYFGCNIQDNRLFKGRRWRFSRHVIEEEKQKLFDAIKANGYKWNAETKTLEKLIESKFKVGDRLKRKMNQVIYTITGITSDAYITYTDMGKFSHYIPFSREKDYELVPNKFDITTLKPFNEVLVRQNNHGKWGIDFFGFYSEGFYYTTGSAMYVQCVPYKDNEHLRGTTNDCDEYFKTWE